VELFTMTLGNDTIELQPFRNWGQLDTYKWTVQGKIPGTPPGLEVTFDHVKLGGETVSIGDPEGCAKLEKAFVEWLSVEKNNLELARKKQHVKPTAPVGSSAEKQSLAFHFRVELDKRGQVHISCLRGSETLTSIGLAVQGFNGLFSQGLMRKPRKLEVGALHDWIELDGDLCSFEHGNNDAAKLEHLLNERYLPSNVLGQGKDILVFANAASPTGFDIQFPVTIGGVPESRRRTLNDAALELLQEPVRCGLLQPGLIIKLSPPNFIFKRKTADGGEAYLEKSAADTVHVLGDDGRERLIDLSKPVNYSHLSVVEMTAVFNHPAVNRHGKASAAPLGTTEPIAQRVGTTEAPPEPPLPPPLVQPKVDVMRQTVGSTTPDPQRAPPAADVGFDLPPASVPQTTLRQPASPPPQPNAWLADILRRPPIRYDWFACLVYFKIAEHFSNSREGNFGPSKCWYVALGDVTDISDPDFAGIFFTEKGWLGFLGRGHVIRFHRGVVFLGTQNSVVEGINIELAALGLDKNGVLVFIVSDDCVSKFGVSSNIIRQELIRLREAGAWVLSVEEALGSPQPLEMIWTVPAEQPNPSDPQAIVSEAPQAPSSETARPELN
jgi:hypothetical protein